MAEIEILKQQHAALVSTMSPGASLAGSRGASPLQAASAASPGRLRSPLKSSSSSSKAGSVKLLVASATR